MKIAHLLWSLDTGGVETMLVDIMNEQAKTQKVKLFLINEHYNKELIQKLSPEVQIYKCRRTPGSRNPIFLLRLNFALIMYKPDILHFHLDNQTKLVWGKFNMVRTIHNTHSSSFDYKKFKRLFCISNAVKKYTASQGYPEGIVIYNGIHTVDIPTSIEPYINKNRIVCVGRLYDDKGQQVLVEAINELVNSRGIKDFTVDFIGDGPNREKLETMARDYGIEDQTNFLGVRPRSWFYPRLKDYGLFIIPSVSEGFGLTLAEACAAKIPVITTDLEGPMEVIKNGELGMSFKTEDHNDLADKMQTVIAGSYDYSLVEKAYDYVINNFDVKATASKYINEYEKLLC